jgi:hypothetical protein
VCVWRCSVGVGVCVGVGAGVCGGVDVVCVCVLNFQGVVFIRVRREEGESLEIGFVGQEGK